MYYKLYDVVGIGFGPSNIALAISFEELFPNIRAHFVEANETSQWQQSMMIVDADIQHSPYLDLVTARNPRSFYSFINYLHQNNRLFEHLNLGLEFPLRKEYADYVRWASEFFAEKVSYSSRVTSISVQDAPYSETPVYCVKTDRNEEIHARSLVVATGRTPFVPPLFRGLPEKRVFHVSDYLSNINRRAPQSSSVAVIGSSQSAVEVILDITERFPHVSVTNYIRHFAYRQKDLSPQMEASIYPSRIAEHYNKTWDQRRRFNDDLKYQNYSSADIDVLKRLNLRDYMHRLETGTPIYDVINNTQITATSVDSDTGDIEIVFQDVFTGKTGANRHDLVVLATGFNDMGSEPEQEKLPPILHALRDKVSFDNAGVVEVELDYAIIATDPGLPPVYLNGLCEGTHGVSDAGSFSLMSMRTKVLAESLARNLGHGDTRIERQGQHRSQLDKAS